MKTIIVWVLLLLAGFSAYGFWRYKNPRIVKMQSLQITTTNSPAGSNFLPEQRRKFALEFASRYKAREKDVTITTTGDFHKSLVMKGKGINEQFVVRMKDNVEAVQEFRDMGFKHLIMTDGRTAWALDLKN